MTQELESGRLVHFLPDVGWPVKWANYAVAASKALQRHEVAAFHNRLVDSEAAGIS